MFGYEVITPTAEAQDFKEMYTKRTTGGRSIQF